MLVSVSVVARPTNVSVDVGSVKVPEFVMLEITGVVSVGDVANTRFPDPVSFVTAEAKLALDGVAKNVATPAPRPLTPVDIGNPVQLVRIPAVGVPKSGVTKVGDVARTTLPVPVVVAEEAAVKRPCASTVKFPIV